MASLIDYKNLVANSPGWQAHGSKNQTVTDKTSTVFIAAPSFVVKAYVGVAGFSMDGYLEATIYYLDLNKQWVKADYLKPTTSCFMSINTKSSTSWFYHNRAAEGTSSTDNHYSHLWRIDFRGETYGTGTGDAKWDVWCGGVDLYTQDEYNSYVWHRKIYYSSCDYFVQGNTYKSPEEFIAGEYYTCRSGTRIDINNVRHVCPAPFN